MTFRLLTAFLIVLGLRPAPASAAAPSCPDDNADPLGGSGEVFGVGPRYVIAGVPQRAQAAGAATVLRAPDAAPGDEFGAAVAISDTTDDLSSPATTCGSARPAATSPATPTRAPSTSSSSRRRARSATRA